MSARLLTAREVAEKFGMSPETVLRKWRAGELPGFRLASNVVRFDEGELEEWLEARRGPDHVATSSRPGEVALHPSAEAVIVANA